jgi:hypothetical protein
MPVKVRVPRYHINPDAFYEDLLLDDLREGQNLPFPAWTFLKSGSGPGTSGPGEGSGSMNLPWPGVNGRSPDGYTNPHARQGSGSVQTYSLLFIKSSAGGTLGLL